MLQIAYSIQYSNMLYRLVNVNVIFNNFLNTFLRIFYACFPVHKSYHSLRQKPWLTSGIKISCVNKRKLYLTYRNNNDPNFKEYYKKYCCTLSKVKNFIAINFSVNLIIKLKPRSKLWKPSLTIMKQTGIYLCWILTTNYPITL